MHTTEQLKEKFNQYLLQNSFTGKPENLYEPVNYIMNLGGKRIRPILVMMACEMYGESPEKALDAALSLEIFHNFTLVHDDIMDEAETRRGEMTIHKKYNQNIAILAGDTMLIQAYKLLGNYDDPELQVALFKIFSELATQLCEGQQMDMNFETTDDVTIDEYLNMIVLKTGVLIAGALKMGALIGGANAEESQKIYNFGKNIGIAFQLQDDLLDTFGTFEKVGKKIGGDIVQNKKTYLYLKAIELSDSKGQEEIKKIYSNKTSLTENEKINKVIKLFKSLVVEEYARQLRDAYLDLSYAHLDSISIPDERKVELRNLGQQLVNRDY
ncbi:polyprenyl synthetase family protein [Portibacter lacus]|uniref:Isoprenyl synthetase n=1 Tax=Portibacter lacus TaxID=1099794 RepID=A0AA37WG10_9BACT|nr:polyprenyl synthetase family protein [Portibacter lacus]GLR19303.1 isoprenyl synthetase [Portibacter lacus]